ncbi:MAG TPA: D-glucuronyl C5-epimerase family protein [Solirubrobacteraceae bacterium]|nr:D-glucuronyl C5-epimerase family protein [Solirubrobacteraceae bacterium]
MLSRPTASPLALALLALLLAALMAAPAAWARPAARPTARTAGRAPTVTSALTGLKSKAAITEAAYTQYTTAYAAAQRSLKRLTGTRHEELASVLANTQAMAASGAFAPSRLPAIFLTLERNRQWWTTEPLLGADQRITFPPSLMVWEHYPGQGLQIQWLATFGKANGYYLAGNENESLRQLLTEVIPLATQRAGGIAWEYMFHFDGGSPPWTSGLSQGTALQVLARAWSRFKEPQYLTAAQQALHLYEIPPPNGVRVGTPAGAEYAEYTYAPSDRILNGFIQALVGIYDYTSITKDPTGLQLFEAGDAEARAEVPHYDTGAWSRYDQFGESNLNYHELLTEFLQHLCERTKKGLPIRQANAPIAADQIYCTTAQHFTAYLHTPPVVSVLTTTLPASARGGVQVSLSKISTVRITIRKGSTTVWTNSALVEAGKPRILWLTPAKPGAYSVAVTATDLAGNFSTAAATIAVTAPKSSKPEARPQSPKPR